MDLSNAKLLRIDTPGTAVGGDVPYTSGATIDVDVVLDEPTSSQKHTLGSVISGATAVMYVQQTVVRKAYRLLVQLEGEAAVLYRVVHVRDRVKDSVTHRECFLQVE